MIEEQPEGITMIVIEGVLMPNGEVICNGKTVGWFDKLKKYLHFMRPNDERRY